MSQADAFGRESVVFLEILQPKCSRVYGDAFFSPTGGCAAQLGVTGDRKCFNTKITCQDEANYNPGTLTLRFGLQQEGLLQYGADAVGSPPEETTPVIPCMVEPPKITPARINLAAMDDSASALGEREVVTVTLQDFKHDDLLVDPYRLERPLSSGSPGVEGYDPYESGTFWGKWAARNPYHGNYLCRVREGYLGDALSAMRVRTYIIDRIDGSQGGLVTLTAKDIFSKIEARKAVAPTASRGELLYDIAAIESPSIATLDPVGIGALDYPAMTGSPSEFYVAIGDEIIKCSRSGDVLELIERGALDTVASAHDQEDLVQWVLVYVSQLAVDIAYDLLVTWGGVPASMIDYTAWQAEAVSLTELYTARIAEPTPVNELLGELSQQAGFTLWADPVSGMIRFKALRAASPTPTVTDDEWIKDGSFSSKFRIDKRASEVWVYYAQRNPLEALDEQRNYRSRLVVADLDAEGDTEYGAPAIRRVFSRWIPQFGRQFAENTANRIISMFRDPPLEATFALHVSRDGELDLAQFFALEVAEHQDFIGAVEMRTMACIALERGENDIGVQAMEVTFVPPEIDTGERVIYIENDDYNLNLRSIYDLLFSAPDAGSPSLQVRFVLLSGVTIGSTSTANPALRTGSWPANVMLTLDNRGRIQGKGGAGGEGGEARIGAGNEEDGLPGETGGDALLIERILRIDNDGGQIWGGGGGGGGGSGSDSNGDAGGGGGGGAGTNSGAGGPPGPVGVLPPGVDGIGANGTSEVGGAADVVILGDGGDGGGPGLAGANGTNNGGTGGSGGAAGKYIDGIANVIWVSSPNGDLRGNVS